MKKIVVGLLILSIIWSLFSVKAVEYRYLNKTIIEKIDKKIDWLKWNKTKTLILLINKVEKVIKQEKNEIKKALYIEFNSYLKEKKNEFDSDKQEIINLNTKNILSEIDEYWVDLFALNQGTTIKYKQIGDKNLTIKYTRTDNEIEKKVIESYKDGWTLTTTVLIHLNSKDYLDDIINKIESELEVKCENDLNNECKSSKKVLDLLRFECKKLSKNEETSKCINNTVLLGLLGLYDSELEQKVDGCDWFPDKINSCISYSCSFRNVFWQIVERKIIGFVDNVCIYNEIYPDNSVNECKFPKSILNEISKNYKLMATDGDIVSSFKYEVDGSIEVVRTINGIEFKDPVNDYGESVCKIKEKK